MCRDQSTIRLGSNGTETIVGGRGMHHCRRLCGAGMLGLPSAGAGAWTLWSMLAVALTMVVMTVSGWMLLESYRGYPLRVSFDTVTRDLLGRRSTPSTISAFISSAASCSMPTSPRPVSSSTA